MNSPTFAAVLGRSQSSLVNALSRIVEDVSRRLTPLRGVERTDERLSGQRAETRRVEPEIRAAKSSSFIDDDVELLGRGGGRGRPVVSVPSSAFFAQHIGQHPEEIRSRREQAASADVAYRDAADLGVVLDRPQPLSHAI